MEDLGLKEYGNIFSFRISSSDSPRATPVYIDSIQVLFRWSVFSLFLR